MVLAGSDCSDLAYANSLRMASMFSQEEKICHK